jgi:hypothetical protein
VAVIIPIESARPIETVERFAVNQVGQWLQLCDQFMAWQRENMLLKEPTPETAVQHRSTLNLLLRVTRLMHFEFAEAEFRDRSVAPMLEAYLRKLEDSWQMFYNPMPKAEAEAMLRECFPDEP